MAPNTQTALKMLDDAYGHLHAAVVQTVPSDDRIIADHVLQAETLVKGARDLFKATIPTGYHCGANVASDQTNRCPCDRCQALSIREANGEPIYQAKGESNGHDHCVIRAIENINFGDMGIREASLEAAEAVIGHFDTSENGKAVRMQRVLEEAARIHGAIQPINREEAAA
jgi:hypothetical protein